MSPTPADIPHPMGPRPDVPAELRGSSVEERIAGRNNIGRSHHDVYRVDRCWNLPQDGRLAHRALHAVWLEREREEEEKVEKH